MQSRHIIYPSGAHEFTPDFKWGSCYSIFSFMCMFCRSLFVILYFFFWSWCCLFFFDLRILITALVSSNSSYHTYYPVPLCLHLHLYLPWQTHGSFHEELRCLIKVEHINSPSQNVIMLHLKRSNPVLY
jgi:hypothetical protein